MNVLHLATVAKKASPSQFWPTRFIAAFSEYQGITINNVKHPITASEYPEWCPDVVILYDIERHPTASARARRHYPDSRIIGVIPYPIMSSFGVNAVRDAYHSCDYLIGDIAELTATFRRASRLNVRHMDTPVRITPRHFYMPEEEADVCRSRAAVVVTTEDYHVPQSVVNRVAAQGYTILRISGDEDLDLLGRMFRLVQYVIVPGFDQKTTQIALEASACGAFVVFHDDHVILRKAYISGNPKHRYYRKGFRSILSWSDALELRDFTNNVRDRKPERSNLAQVISPFLSGRPLEEDHVVKKLLCGGGHARSISS